jgi:hypothetical protein
MDKTNESFLKETQEGNSNELRDEVAAFSHHCAYIRSVYVLATHIWRDSSEHDRKVMEQISPSFFLDTGQVLSEYVVLAACRITDPAKTGKRENLTLETFVDSFSPDSPSRKNSTNCKIVSTNIEKRL